VQSPEQVAAAVAALEDFLPALRPFVGSRVVVKYGGHAMKDSVLGADFARGVVLLGLMGVQVVVVHGGGPQVNAMLERLEIPIRFVQGQRVTDDRIMEVLEMVLGGTVNQAVVSLVNRHGGRAVGLCGKDANLLQARRFKLGQAPDGGDPAGGPDLGRVGEVQQVNTTLLDQLMEGGFTPVVAPLGVEEDGRPCNINADLVAGSLAAAMMAQRLIMLSDVPGVLDGGGSRVERLEIGQAGQMIAQGTLHGGMLPKIHAARTALEGGVKAVHIADGRKPNALLLELVASSGMGTVIHS